MAGQPELSDRTSVLRGLDFSEILRCHGAALRGRALWLTKNPSDASDLLQDTIEHALRASRREIPPSSILRWLLVIMHNVFLDDRRAAAVRRVVPVGQHLNETLASHPPSSPELWRTVDDEVVTTCFLALPEKMQQVLRLHTDGETYARIARRLKLQECTVGTRLFRARRQLRDAIVGVIGGAEESP